MPVRYYLLTMASLPSPPMKASGKQTRSVLGNSFVIRLRVCIFFSNLTDYG